MAELAITFGVQYAREFHGPTAGRAHPDGYWVIEADNLEIARAGAFARFGQQWAFDYDLHSEKFQADIERWYTRGELGRTRVTHWYVDNDGLRHVTTEEVR